jgi:hypothetical protein
MFFFMAGNYRFFMLFQSPVTLYLYRLESPFQEKGPPTAVRAAPEMIGKTRKNREERKHRGRRKKITR